VLAATAVAKLAHAYKEHGEHMNVT